MIVCRFPPNVFDLQFFTHVISINFLKNQFSLDYIFEKCWFSTFFILPRKTKSQRSKATCHKLHHNTEIRTEVFTLLIYPSLFLITLNSPQAPPSLEGITAWTSVYLHQPALLICCLWEIILQNVTECRFQNLQRLLYMEGDYLYNPINSVSHGENIGFRLALRRGVGKRS